MPRPRLFRNIRLDPKVTYYKPQGIPMRQLKVMKITFEEMETLRLKNVLGLKQTDSAKKMKTSQSTFQRIFCEAQKKLSTAIINGMAIEIIKE
jgi:predicted DNA-binding protein (UPF0251 family)